MTQDIFKQLKKIKETNALASDWKQRGLEDLKSHMKANPVKSSPMSSKPPVSNITTLILVIALVVIAIIILKNYIGVDTIPNPTASVEPTIEDSVTPSTTVKPSDTQKPTISNSATPTPSQTPTNTTTATPTQSQNLSCSPNYTYIDPSSSSTSDYLINFRATGGTGEYSWSAPTASPSNGTGENFTTSFINSGPGTHPITVTSGNKEYTCNVVIGQSSGGSPTPTPTTQSMQP